MRRNVTASSDEQLDHIAAVLDDVFRFPGTNIRFGLDFLIGWIPGIGDALSGMASLIIVAAAWKRGAALVTLARMITNVILETVIGSIPVLGDVFHVVWKANRRNYRLFMREKNRGADESYVWRDVAFFVLLFLGGLFLICAPIALVYWLIHSIFTAPYTRHLFF